MWGGSKLARVIFSRHGEVVGGSGPDLKVLWRCRSTPPSFHPSPPFLPSSLLHSENLAERYIEDQGSVGRDDRRTTLTTVCLLRGDGEPSRPSHCHSSHADVPTLDHLAPPQPEDEGLLLAGVEHLPIGFQLAHIIHRYAVA